MSNKKENKKNTNDQKKNGKLKRAEKLANALKKNIKLRKETKPLIGA